MKKKKITKSFSNLAEYRDRFSTFGDVKPSDVKPSDVKPSIVKPINVTDINQVNKLLIDAEKFIKEWLLPTKALFDMDGMKLDVKSHCVKFLAKNYGIFGNTEILNKVLMLCKKYGLF